MTTVTNYLDMAENDRQVALLTSTQRDYLEGEEVTASYERNLRDQIHDRIEATMADFELLFSELSEEDMKEAFEGGYASKLDTDDKKLQKELEKGGKSVEVDSDDVSEDIPRTRGTAVNSIFAIAFLLRGLNYDNESVYEHIEELGEEQPAFSEFINVVESGLELYLREEENIHVNADVSIELTGFKATFLDEDD